MTDQPPTALATALAYHQAWTSKDIDQAMRHVDSEIVCQAPGRQVAGAAAYRQFLAGFARQLTEGGRVTRCTAGRIRAAVQDGAPGPPKAGGGDLRRVRAQRAKYPGCARAAVPPPDLGQVARRLRPARHRYRPDAAR